MFHGEGSQPETHGVMRHQGLERPPLPIQTPEISTRFFVPHPGIERRLRLPSHLLAALGESSSHRPPGPTVPGPATPAPTCPATACPSRPRASFRRIPNRRVRYALTRPPGPLPKNTSPASGEYAAIPREQTRDPPWRDSSRHTRTGNRPVRHCEDRRREIPGSSWASRKGFARFHVPSCRLPAESAGETEAPPGPGRTAPANGRHRTSGWVPRKTSNTSDACRGRNCCTRRPVRIPGPDDGSAVGPAKPRSTPGLQLTAESGVTTRGAREISVA